MDTFVRVSGCVVLVMTALLLDMSIVLAVLDIVSSLALQGDVDEILVEAEIVQGVLVAMEGNFQQAVILAKSSAFLRVFAFPAANLRAFSSEDIQRILRCCSSTDETRHLADLVVTLWELSRTREFAFTICTHAQGLMAFVQKVDVLRFGPSPGLCIAHVLAAFAPVLD
jgi:hypothetical protein